MQSRLGKPDNRGHMPLIGFTSVFFLAKCIAEQILTLRL